MTKMRTALICGASKGIGRATAHELAKQGHKLHLLARNSENLETTANECLNFGAKKVRIWPVNLEIADDLQFVLNKVLEKGPVEILINNASGPPAGPLIDASVDEMINGLNRHLFASHYCVQACIAGMIQKEWGRIINIISTSVKEPIENLGVSNTIRGAVASWSKSLNLELPGYITINNVLPGFTNTERLSSLSKQISEQRGITSEDVKEAWIKQVPLGRLIEPTETAAIIGFLCSELGSSIRGVSLPVDGGRLRSI